MHAHAASFLDFIGAPGASDQSSSAGGGENRKLSTNPAPSLNIVAGNSTPAGNRAEYWISK